MTLSRVLFCILSILTLNYARMVEAKCESLSAKIDQVSDSLLRWEQNTHQYKAESSRNGHFSDTTFFDKAEQYYNKLTKNLYQAKITRCVENWDRIAYTIHHGQQNDEDFQDFTRKFDIMVNSCTYAIQAIVNCSRRLIESGKCSNKDCRV